jgi:hypothetical protein
MRSTVAAWESQGFPKATGVAALAIGLFAVWIGWGIGGDTSVLYVDDLGTALAALAATVLCVRAGARHAGQLRPFWWLLGAACAAWTLAEVIWAVYDFTVGEVPSPSWADFGYLAAIPLAVAALIRHPAMQAGVARTARSMLDGLILATALLFVSWTMVIGPLGQSADLTTLGGVVALAYPFGDVVIVFFIVLAVRGMTHGGRVALWCLLGGLLAMALSDTTYAYLTQVKTYGAGNLIDAGWFAAYLGIALGAYCSNSNDGVAERARSSSPTRTSLIAPFLPVLGALSIIAFGGPDRLDRVALISALGLITLTLARQGLLVLDLFQSDDQREVAVSERLTHAVLGGFVHQTPGPDGDRHEP